MQICNSTWKYGLTYAVHLQFLTYKKQCTFSASYIASVLIVRILRNAYSIYELPIK